MHQLGLLHYHHKQYLIPVGPQLAVAKFCCYQASYQNQLYLAAEKCITGVVRDYAGCPIPQTARYYIHYLDLLNLLRAYEI